MAILLNLVKKKCKQSPSERNLEILTELPGPSFNKPRGDVQTNTGHSTAQPGYTHSLHNRAYRGMYDGTGT